MRAGLPREPAELIALAAALLVVVAAPRLARIKDRAFLILAMIAAAALSALYVAFYLRGGPRIIDATTYFLEARALAEGHLAFPIGEPPAATMGRFLVRAGGDGDRAAGIFPPGYPAVLAIGFLLRAPLAIGPALAAALVAATWSLARRVAPAEPEVARIAALGSVVCAALRYHTADTMSHGLAALCFTGALAATLGAVAEDASPRDARPRAALAGAFAGWLAATRPASALALIVTLGFAILSCPAPRRAAVSRLVPLALLGALPGIALLLAHQHAATGAWLMSSQRLYYAVSDGPPGCFAYGFGPEVGCVGEHGDFVRANLEHGYGLVEAIGTTLRRLRLHLVDVGNAEPLFALVLVGAWLGVRDRLVRVLGVGVVAQVVASAPFYFDGNYPGGGARFFADVLPLEHVLFALGAVTLASRLGEAPARGRWAAVALALGGFAFRGGFEHAALRDREGGRPMFEPEVLASHGVTAALVFMTTDHGFNLAFDPGADSRTAVAAARLRGDAIDALGWEARGRPPAFVYDYAVPTGQVLITPWKPQVDVNGPLRIEGASLWPPVAQHGARAAVEFGSAPCNASGRILAIHAAGASPSVELELPRALAGREIAPDVVLSGRQRGAVSLSADGLVVHRWTVSGEAAGPICAPLQPASTPTGARKIHLIVDLEESEVKGLFAIGAVDIATSKYVDPLPSKVRDSQGIH